MTSLPSVSSPAECALSVKIHRSEAEVDQLRPFWMREQRHPNSDLDHFLLVCRLRSDVVAPCVFSVWRNGCCIGVLAGRIECSTIQPQVGYFKLPPVRSRLLGLIHEGAIGKLGPLEADLILGRIRRCLADGDVDMAAFSQIFEASPLFAGIGAMGSGVLEFSKPRWAEHWALTLPSQAGFLVQRMRSKHRSWIRKKATDLEKAFGGRIGWRWHAHIDDVAPLCRQMEAVAARTYQRGLGAGFRDDREHRDRLSLFARQGTLRIMLLEVDGQPAAFWLGIAYRGVDSILKPPATLGSCRSTKPGPRCSSASSMNLSRKESAASISG